MRTCGRITHRRTNGLSFDAAMRNSLCLIAIGNSHVLRRSETGSLYFTDPRFGSPTGLTLREKSYPSVACFTFRRMAGKVSCLQRNGPNGLAFSPDEKYFNDNWANKEEVIIRYDVNADGTLSSAKCSLTRAGYSAASGAKGAREALTNTDRSASF